VVLVQHVDVAGRGDEDVALGRSLGHRHDPEAVHRGFERLERVDFGHDDISAQALGAQPDAAAAPAVPGHDHLLAGDEHVGRADDAVHGALARAIAVVEQVLGHCVVDRDHGEHQLAIVRHRAQADDAGGGFLGAADDAVEQLAALLVQRADQVRAVVHGDVGLEIERGLDVLVVGRVVFTLDRVDGHLVMGDERGSNVILGRERVGRGQHHVCAAGLQDAHQVGRLARDVQTRGNAQAVQRPLFGEPRFDQVEHRHLARGPLHAEPALVCQADVLDVVVSAHSVETPFIGLQVAG